jgi:hypothetical protein
MPGRLGTRDKLSRALRRAITIDRDYAYAEEPFRLYLGGVENSLNDPSYPARYRPHLERLRAKLLIAILDIQLRNFDRG